MGRDNIVKLWQDSVGEFPKIEYGKDKSFAVLYTEKDGEWLRNNGKLLMYSCRYQLTEDNPRIYTIHGTDTGSCPEDFFMVGFQIEKS